LGQEAAYLPAGYRTSTHETTGTVPANMVFERELRLPYDLLFRAPPDEEQSTSKYMVDLVDQIHDIHHYTGHHLKVARYRIKAYYNCLVNSSGLKEGEQVWFHHLT
jgi:hypothetical protein